MRRRRQKNPLLMRIIVISVGVHILALPVLAHFGAFKKIQAHFVETKIVVLAPPPSVAKQEPAKAAKKAPSVAAHSRSSSAHASGARSSANHVHIAMAQGGPDDSGGPGTQQGTLDPGTLPKGDTAPMPDKKAGTGEEVVTPKDPVVKNNVPTPVAPTVPKTVEKVQETIVTPTPMPVHEPVFTEAAPIEGHQPQPSIPDEIRSDALDTTVVVEVSVGVDGVPVSANITQSTGKKDLDRLALDTAKQWRFKPATRDGAPIESKVRLHIEFQVN